MADTGQPVPIPDQLVEWARAAETVVVLTGAGMSAESGIATFRDAETGLWSRFDPQQLATEDAFRADPDLVFGWYAWRYDQWATTRPNAGHEALARWGDRADVRVVTQNIDDLHERAGSTWVRHLHGSLFTWRCFDCGRPYVGPIPQPDHEAGRVPPPRCGSCGGPIRPGVVWFGEMLPTDALDDGIQACQDADLVLVVGTSGIVYPAAGLPEIALGLGTPVVEVNPDSTPLTYRADAALRGTAATVLPALVDALG